MKGRPTASNADGSPVGVNLNKYPVPPVIDLNDDRFDLCDLHDVSTFSHHSYAKGNSETVPIVAFHITE